MVIIDGKAVSLTNKNSNITRIHLYVKIAKCIISSTLIIKFVSVFIKKELLLRTLQVIIKRYKASKMRSCKKIMV
jgi:hypothetical protein